VRLLLVDDDVDVRASVRLGFELQWRDIEVLEAERGADALRLVEEHRPDLVLLDVGLPDIDGYGVLREIRAFSSVPVIMLTARDQPIDKVRGLEGGADDYIAKPFDHLELMARVRAVLRRLDVKAPTQRTAAYRKGSVEIDTDAHVARVEGAARIWGREEPADLDALRVFVRRLRSKLGDDAAAPRYIETVRGLGYRLLGEG
jgi:DNA-binding response OmpR family regulator